MKRAETATTPSKYINMPNDADGVSCNGGGVTGHPRVYYSFDGSNILACHYCGRLFVKSS